MVKKLDKSLQQKVHQYLIVGRLTPTAKNPNPKIYRMKIFAPNEVLGKSKFWYYMKKMNKIKKSVGEVLSVSEIFEKDPHRVKNFGVWLRYDSRTGTHNMYKEFRDTTQNGAISQVYSDMSGRHRALSSNIAILRICEVKASDCRREIIKQMHNSKLKFPAVRRLMCQSKSKRRTFQPYRPKLFLN